MGNVAFLVAAALFAICLPLFRAESYSRLCFLTINLGFAFWYWIPGLRLLNILPTEGTAADLSAASLNDAAWLVLAYHAMAVLTLVATKAALDRNSDRRRGGRIPVALCAYLVFASSILYVVVRYLDEGTDLVVQLLIGLVSARDYMSYFNRSETAAASLLALWDIANIWLALFVLAVYVIRREVFRSGAVVGGFALVASFLASGSRSILLMALFVLLLGILGRETGHRPTRHGASRISYAAVFMGGLAVAIVVLAVSVRFESANSSDSLIVESVLNNNDMFRELAFVDSQLSDYQSPSFLAFVLTPFTFALPSFLGFEKTIPDHLVYFNEYRAGIDLILGQGNVFPGIIADFHMEFGFFGPLLLSLFLISFIYAARLASCLFPDPTIRLAYQIVFLSYMFVSFRNILGSLALVLLFSVVFLKALGKPARRASLDSIGSDARMS